MVGGGARGISVFHAVVRRRPSRVRLRGWLGCLAARAMPRRRPASAHPARPLLRPMPVSIVLAVVVLSSPSAATLRCADTSPATLQTLLAPESPGAGPACPSPSKSIWCNGFVGSCNATIADCGWMGAWCSDPTLPIKCKDESCKRTAAECINTAPPGNCSAEVAKYSTGCATCCLDYGLPTQPAGRWPITLGYACRETCGLCGIYNRENKALRALAAATNISGWGNKSRWLNETLGHCMWDNVACSDGFNVSAL